MIAIKNNFIFVEGYKEPKGYIQEGKYHSIRYRNKPNKKGFTHYYLIGEGYPIGEEILIWLKDHDISEIVIIEKSMDGNKYLHSTVIQYLSKPENDVKYCFDWGYGKQRCIPRMEMSE